MLEHIQRLVRRDEETGASAVEYGLLVAAIAALIVLIVFALGGVVEGGLHRHLHDDQGERVHDRQLQLTSLVEGWSRQASPLSVLRHH